MKAVDHSNTRALSAIPTTLIFAGLTVLAVALLQAPIALDIDVSYYLSVGRIVSDGLPLYTGYIEGNPPGPVVLAQASHAVSTSLGLPLDITHKYVVLGVQALAYGLTLAVVSPVLPTTFVSRGVVVFGLGVAMLMISPEIGRRDYIGTVALMPWALSLVVAWNGRRTGLVLSLVVGLAAGLAMIFKPHFALIAFAIGLFDLAHAGVRPWRLQLQTWVAFVTCLASYAWFLLAHPVYLTQIVPFAMDTFSRMQPGPLFAAQSMVEIWLIGGLGLLICGARFIRRFDPLNRWLWPLGVVAALAVAGGAAMVITQAFGLAYHHMPIKITVFAALFAMCGWALCPDRALWIKAGAVVLAVALTGYCVRFYPAELRRAGLMAHPLTQAMQPDTPGAPVLMVSSSVMPTGLIYPLIDAGWAGVSAVHWPLVALMAQDGRTPLNNPPPETRRRELQDWYLGLMANRLAAMPPERVAIDVTAALRWFENDGFDILRWLRSDPRFDAAWVAARLAPTGDPIAFRGRVFQIYAPSGG